MKTIFKFFQPIHYSNKTLIVFLLFFIFTPKTYAQNITDTIYREEDIYKLLDQIENDNQLQLEWLTALHFHKLVNDYRNSKNKKSVHWDHKLWMAARNHNIYLLRAVKHLSHSEVRSKPFYSGNQPQDRVEYVVYNSRELKIAVFENCYGISSLDRLTKSDISKKEMKKIAKQKANEAFEAWKKSSGHNKNMLDAEHITHGTSIIFGGFGIHGTSIFARAQKYYQPDTLFLPFLETIVDKDDFLIDDNYQDFELPKNVIKRLNYKYFYLVAEFFKKHEIESNKALYKMTQRGSVPKNQKERNKYYRKEGGIKGFFELLTHEPKYLQTTFDMSFEEYKKLKGGSKIRNWLQQKLDDEATGAKSWGGNINSKRRGEEVRIEVDMVFLVKKH